MKFAIVILAVVAAVSAQQNGQYNPYAYNQYPYNRYNYNPYNPFARQPFFNPQDYYKPSTYRPFAYSTPSPFVSSTYTPPKYPTPTFAPSTIAPPVIAPVVPKIYSNEADRQAQTLRAENDISPDGSFSYFFETSNGIAAQEQGVPRNFGGNPPIVPVVTQGSFAWTSPEGVPVAISYTADENGYQPQGDAIPTPPPVPEPIARALDFIARTAPPAPKK